MTYFQLKTQIASHNCSHLKFSQKKKAQVITKIDEEILEEIEGEDEIATEVKTAEEIHSEITNKIIKIENLLEKMKIEEKLEHANSTIQGKEARERCFTEK